MSGRRPKEALDERHGASSLTSRELLLYYWEGLSTISASARGPDESPGNPGGKWPSGKRIRGEAKESRAAPA
jgi:hypothetical protein